MVGRNLGRKLGFAIKKIQEAFLADYLEVLLDEVDRVLCLLGVHGVFIDCLVQEAIHKPMVTWLARRKKVKAASTSFAWRAGGGDSLGLRLKKTPAVLPVSTWRVKGFRASWTQSELLKVMSDARWSNGQVVAYPTKKIRPWLIRLQLYNQVTGLLAGIQVGEGAFLLTVRR